MNDVGRVSLIACMTLNSSHVAESAGVDVGVVDCMETSQVMLYA